MAGQRGDKGDKGNQGNDGLMGRQGKILKSMNVYISSDYCIRLMSHLLKSKPFIYSGEQGPRGPPGMLF